MRNSKGRMKSTKLRKFSDILFTIGMRLALSLNNYMRHHIGVICMWHVMCKEQSQYLCKEWEAFVRSASICYFNITLIFPSGFCWTLAFFCSFSYTICKFRHIIRNKIYFLTNGHVKARLCGWKHPNTFTIHFTIGNPVRKLGSTNHLFWSFE